MAVVSDSTTLIILYDLGKLHYLENLFAKIYIPQAVYDEISYKKEFTLAPFIEIVQVDANEQLSELMMLLDEGESQAIALAIHKQIPLIIDEKKGRKIALNLDVPILGLLGVLYLNMRKKYLTKNEVANFLNEAKKNGYRISEKLISQMFQEIASKLQV